MLKTFSIAAGFAVSTMLGSAAWAVQEQVPNQDVQNQTGTNPAAPGAPVPGVATQQPAPGLASAMANFMVRTGIVAGTDARGRLVVEHVRPESDAARLGVKPGDALTSVNGTETPTMTALQNYLGAHSLQSAFNVGMGRGDRNFTRPMGRQMSLMGMSVFADSADRPVVNSVQPDSPAAKAGIRQGDTITSVGRQTTDTMSKFMNMTLPLVRALDPGEKVPFQIARNGRMMKISVPRPSDAELQPLTPAEQHVLDQQGGVISPTTQEIERPRTERRVNRRPIVANTFENNSTTVPNQRQQQQPQNNNGGFGGLLGGLGGGGLGTGTTGATGTNGMNGQINSVVAALYASQGAGTTTGTTTSGSTTANTQNRNTSRSGGVVGYVTIQSTVPLSQSANNPFGVNTGTGTTANGTTTNGTMGTTNNTGATNNTGTANTVNGLGNSGFGQGTANAVTGFPMANGFNGAANGTGANLSGTNANGTPNSASVFGSAGGANPVTGNTGTPQGVNPQTGNTGNGTENINNQNGNNPSTVSATVNGLPAGNYTLVVTQYGNCGDAAGVATGPTSATLGTLQVGANGQGSLTNVRVQYAPQAYVGRVVAVVGGQSGSATLLTPQTGPTANNNNGQTVACGVFRNANGRRPFTNGEGNGFGSPFLGNTTGTTGTGTTTNGTNNGNGTVTNPVTGQPMPTPPPVHPLGGTGTAAPAIGK